VMMLDTKTTFDSLIDSLAPTPEKRESIKNNLLYRYISTSLAGTQEYMAMEKLYAVKNDPSFDIVLLDTPPTQNALDFLDAPERLLEFLDSRLVKILIHPAMVAGRLGARWFEWGTRRALSLIERISGIGFLQDVSEFLLAFEHMSEGFRARAKEVRSLLLGPQAAFVLVASPENESVKSAQRFLARLEASSVSVAGIVANRVRAWPGVGAAPPREAFAADPAPLAHALARHGRDEAMPDSAAERAARAALDAAARYAAFVRRDAVALGALREHAERRGSFFRVVPELSGDVHDLAGLLRVAAALAQAPGASGQSGRGEAMTASGVPQSPRSERTSARPTARDRRGRRGA